MNKKKWIAPIVTDIEISETQSGGGTGTAENTYVTS